MSKRISSEQMERILAPFEDFSQVVEDAMKLPTRKQYRAKRSAMTLRGTFEKQSVLSDFSLRISYDTKENRWLFFLLTSLSKHLFDLAERYSMDTAEKDSLDTIRETLSRWLFHKIFRSA